MCNKCKNTSCVDSSTCENNTQINTDDVFYSSDICNPITQGLTNLNLPVGSNLSTILRKIDYKLGDNLNTVNFNGFNLSYLRSKYSITNIKSFAEALDIETNFLKTSINTNTASINTVSDDLTDLSELVNTIKYPGITDTSNVGFTVNNDINYILQKIVNKFSTVGSGSSNSPSITSNDSGTIRWNNNGTLNHNLSASVKISSQLNNKLQVLADGLYVNNTTVINQTLSLSNNQLTISGGNTVTLPIAGLQQLSLSGNSLSISGGNTIILPSLQESTLVANDSSTIDFTTSGTNGHTLTAQLKVSSNANNKASILSDGLYVTVSALDVLNEINADSTLKTIFCNIATTCASGICYKWFIKNTDTNPVNVSYVDVNGISQTATIGASSSQPLSGLKITTLPTTTLSLTFLGQC